MKVTWAWAAARSMSASVASGSASAMLSRRVPVRRKGSSGTTVMAWRTSSAVARAMSTEAVSEAPTPTISTEPESAT